MYPDMYPHAHPGRRACYRGFARASDGSAAGARLRLAAILRPGRSRGTGAPEHPALDAPKHWRPTSRTVSESPNAAVLVVDDVPENRDLLVRRLKRLGINDVEQAANGIEALAAIERKNFDLVLLDIMMPELDGFGVLERLKQSGRINDLPVVVISALNEIEPVVRCVELGAEDFIFKPFNPTLLRARVMASLEKKALRDRTRDELRRKQMELDEARTLQLALVPAPLRDSICGRTAAVDAVLEPAKEVGGDLVDHFRIGEDLLVVSVGDVSDKGAGAALMMARTHALVRGLSVRPDAAALFREPEKAVSLLNAALAKGNDSGMFVTLLLGTLDFAGNRLAYVRAGHVPPYLRRADGSRRAARAAWRTSARLDGEGGLQVGHHGLRGRRRDPGADRWLHGSGRSRRAIVRRGSDCNLHAAGRSRRSRAIVHAGPAGPRLRRRPAAVGRHGGHFALAARRRDGMNRSR